MDWKPEKVKNGIFVNFDLFFGITLVLSLNLNELFAATDATIYLKKILKIIYSSSVVSIAGFSAKVCNENFLIRHVSKFV